MKTNATKQMLMENSSTIKDIKVILVNDLTSEITKYLKEEIRKQAERKLT